MNKTDELPEEIAICVNEDCPLRDKCSRDRLSNSPSQNYFRAEYKIVNGKPECEYFEENKDGK
jgi:hypothetical protein